MTTALIVVVDPATVHPLATQVGGHRTDEHKAPKGLCQCDAGGVLKPLGEGERSQRELAFYDRLASSAELEGLRSLVPRYDGVALVGDERYLAMEDLCGPFKHVCVGDFKIGRHTYDERASAQKRAKEDSKYPSQAQLGFRITGMRVFDPATREYCEYDRFYGRALTPETISTGIRTFLQGDIAHLRHRVAQTIVDELEKTIAWFRHQRFLRFYSSSVLIAFDGDHNGSSAVNVRLIDFAHTYPIEDGGLDESTLFGLTSLQSHFRAFAVVT